MQPPLRYRLSATTIGLLVLLIAWHLLTQNQSRKSALLYPSPRLLLETWTLHWRTIAEYSFTTWYRVLAGLALGSIMGIGAGVLMTYSRLFYYLLDPFIEIVRPIPPIALTPFFILWFGLGDLSQLLLISMGCFMIMAISTLVGITNVNPVYARAAQSLGASKLHTFQTIYLPAIMPGLLAGVRVALASAFALTVAAEYLGAQGGLGYLIRNARTILHTETILLGALILGLQSLITDYLLRILFNHLTKWTPKVH